jgi:NTP pyrophosphatase (non-canonical NTP hydrolase)
MAPSKTSPSQDRYHPCTEQLQLAASSYLCTVLKRDQLCGNVFHDHQEIDAVYRLSLLHMQMTFISTPLPASYSSGTLHLTLMFASLLNLIQWRHDLKMNEYETMVQSTFFIENVINLLFPSPGNSQSPSFHALDLLDCWALSGGLAWVVFRKHEKQWRSAIVDFWTCARARQMDTMIPQLPVMVLLHCRSRLPSRVALSLIFQNNTITRDHIPLEDTGNAIVTALSRLFQSSEQSTILYAASLLRVLLSDRCSLSTHDDISRALWGSIGVECLEQILNCVLLQVSDPQEAFRPSTLALLDLLDTLLQEQKNCDLVLKIISVHHFERIITLLESKKENFAGQDDLSHGQNSNTPPANHLSRIEDTSTISVEEEDDRVSVGLDSTLHLSCATILARLGNSDASLTEEGLHLMKARACNVVTDFVAGFYSRAPRTKGLLSFDHNKRSLRLQLAVGTSENEDLLATALFSAQLLQKSLYLEMQDDAHTAQSKLKAAEDRARDLEGQVKKLAAETRSQSIIARRELSRVKENACQDAKQLVAIHAAERSSAENRFIACRRELEKAESELRNALVQADESKRILSITNDELQHALAKTLEIEKDNKELSRQIEQEVARAAALKEEIHCQDEKLDSLFRRTQQLEGELQESGKAIEEFQATNESLRDNLEELFADMVNLATVYESKEGELAAIHRKYHDELEGVHRNLRREKERGKELQKARDELQETNERLQRKLEKYKQRLEEERRDREEDNIRRKRNGPVSYINQLHQATSLDRSRDPSMAKESGSSLSVSRSRLEKENAYTYSSSSLHRNNML